MTKDEALGIVLDAAEDWAGEYGFVVPEAATLVFAAIKVLEEELDE